MVSRETRRAMAHQIFQELMAGEFSAEVRPEISRKSRREQAWVRAKLMAKSMVVYAEQQAIERAQKPRDRAEAHLIKAEDITIG
jgi:hypothetical protein